eukprot:4059588-Pyramimonas_sp.AAC.1
MPGPSNPVPKALTWCLFRSVGALVVVVSSRLLALHAVLRLDLSLKNMRPSAGPHSRTFEGALPQDAQKHPTSTKNIRVPSPDRPRS